MRRGLFCAGIFARHCHRGSRVRISMCLVNDSQTGTGKIKPQESGKPEIKMRNRKEI